MKGANVEIIKERLNIADVVGSYIKLQKAGVNFKAKCPFHNEKTPSFFVSPIRNSFYCFGCGAKGDIFSFVEKFEGLDFKGALKLLAERAGVQIEEINQNEAGEKDQLFRVLEEATLHFQSELKKRPDAIAYLKSRGVSDQTIIDFRIGFSKKDWRDTTSFLRSRGFKDEILDKAGLSKLGERGAYDRFRGRIMFPITDSLGRVIAFSGRIFDEEFDEDGKKIELGKYINSPETPLYSKSRVLYGIDKAKNGIRKWSFAIMVEGQMDLLMMHQIGFTNTVAVSGTSVTEEHFAIIQRLTDRLLFALDQDKAGLSALLKGASVALSLGMDVKVVKLSLGKDPAEEIKENSEKFKQSLREAKHVIEFFLDVIRGYNFDERKFRLEVRRVILPLLAEIKSPMDRAHFIGVVSEAISLPASSIEMELSGLAKKEKTYEKPVEESITKKQSILRRIAGIKIAIGLPEDLEADYDEICREGNFLIDDDLANKSAFELEKQEIPKARLFKEARELIYLLRKEVLFDKRNAIQLELKDLEKQRGDSKDLIQSFHKITKEITEIENKINSLN